jgi:hypothetical protein
MLRVLAGASVLLAATSALAADWRIEVRPSGLRVAEGIGEARVGDRSADARLALECQPGERGLLSWHLSVDRPGALGFDFDAFDGPDAPAASARLGEVTLEGGLLRPRFAVAMAGWYDGPDRFALAFSAPSNAAGDGALLADSIGPGTKALTWRVAPPSGAGEPLRARFALDGAHAALREAMAGCGPAPAITDALRAAWRGRTPQAIDWFAQRAVAWRLKGLLGARWDAVLPRLAGAEPIGTDGETVFVLAPSREAPRDGVAILMRGESTEVVLVDDGRVERLVSGRGAIPLPDAVRAFVAARSQAAGG